VLDGQAGIPAWLWVAVRAQMSGCGGDAGPGDVVGGELVEGVERRGEFGGALGRSGAMSGCMMWS
jgi:hypothetical protein